MGRTVPDVGQGPNAHSSQGCSRQPDGWKIRYVATVETLNELHHFLENGAKTRTGSGNMLLNKSKNYLSKTTPFLRMKQP
jgi:hypothetical protein